MARDIIHNATKQALINDEWAVTHDPFQLEVDEDETRGFEVDLGAEKMIGATKDKREILVEVKSFGGTSILYKFHEALGQYLDYSAAIVENEINRELYIAVSATTY